MIAEQKKLKTYDICYGFLENLDSDTSMLSYEKAENMADMIRRLLRESTDSLVFRIIDFDEKVATLYIPNLDVNKDGEFRRIYLYGWYKNK